MFKWEGGGVTLVLGVGKESPVLSWCHLARDLRQGGTFPGRGKGRCRSPEMGLCVEEQRQD